MGMPHKLKDFNLFENGISFAGMATEVTLPKLSRKMEEYRAGGMSGPVSVDLGQEAIQLEWTAGGLVKEALKQYATKSHGAVQLRFAGAYQNDRRNRQIVCRHKAAGGNSCVEKRDR